MELKPLKPDERSMVPSSDRLLRGIQAAMVKIGKHVSDEQSRAELSIIDIVLSELARRNQHEFYLDYYRALRLLLADGLGLPELSLPAEDVELMEHELATCLPAELQPGRSYDSVALDINRVMRHLEVLVHGARDGSDSETQSFLQRIVSLENGFHVHRMQNAQVRKDSLAGFRTALTADRLQNYLTQRLPEKKGLQVTNFEQLVGGFQKVTVMFETKDDHDNRESLVLRAEKDDQFVALDASEISKEYEIVRYLYDAGAVVAEPLWLEPNDKHLGNRFMVSRRAVGENFGSAIAAKPMTDEIARSFIEAIAKVHMLPITDALKALSIGRWLEFPTAQKNARGYIEFMASQPWMNDANPSALTARLITWLVDNAPTDVARQCVIHCDFGPHNAIVNDGRITAIIDWETSRIGDPADDIAWFLQSCRGQVSYDRALDWYEEITGHRISDYRLRYYDVIGCFKIMVASLSAEAMFEARDDASILWCGIPFNFAAFGTRMVEEKIRLAESCR